MALWPRFRDWFFGKDEPARQYPYLVALPPPAPVASVAVVEPALVVTPVASPVPPPPPPAPAPKLKRAPRKVIVSAPPPPPKRKPRRKY